ncbi:MAG: response regulator transcription factor, partial [Acidothermaceae bacterium]
PDGYAALTIARTFDPDLVLLDVMMPGIDGFEVARRLRARADHRPPVLFLSARDSDDDKLTGLTVGGDDYVTKPFSLEEVVARIRSILRRTRPTSDAGNALLTIGDLTLDEDTYEVHKAGQAVELSTTEFKVLRYFMRNPGKVLSKTQILDHVWPYEFRGDVNIVESYVSHLRRKVDTTQPRLLHTLRGVGYALRVAKR